MSSAAENQYRIPKQRVPAVIAFAGAPPQTLNLYLSERAATHEGYERPSDLLNKTTPFLPATGPDGSVLILNRHAIRWVQIELHHEFEDATEVEVIPHPDLTEAEIEVILSDESHLRGTVSFCLPGSQRRVQDFLNLPDAFLVLRQEDVAVLINKDQIVHVSLI